MSAKARALKTLYRLGRIGKPELRQTVTAGIITAEEYKSICGEVYECPA